MPPIWALSCSDSHFVNMFFVTVTLTFDLVTWKSIGVICESWSMYLWSFMILGPSVELSSGNHLVYGPTDWPTCAKQYTPSSSKGGHKNSNILEIQFCLEARMTKPCCRIKKLICVSQLSPANVSRLRNDQYTNKHKIRSVWIEKWTKWCFIILKKQQ